MHTWYRFLQNRVYVFISVLRWRYRDRHGPSVSMLSARRWRKRPRRPKPRFRSHLRTGEFRGWNSSQRGCPQVCANFFCVKFSKHISPDGWGTSPWVAYNDIWLTWFECQFRVTWCLPLFREGLRMQNAGRPPERSMNISFDCLLIDLWVKDFWVESFINDLQFSGWKRTLTHPLEQATMPKGWCRKDHESGQLLERSKSVCHFFAFGSFRQPLGNMTFDSPQLPKCCAPHLQLPRKSPPARASCFYARALVEDKYSVTVVSNFVWRHPLKPATVLIHLYGRYLNLHSTSSAQT